MPGVFPLVALQASALDGVARLCCVPCTAPSLVSRDAGVRAERRLLPGASPCFSGFQKAYRFWFSF